MHSPLGPTFTMADLVALTGVRPSTIRYYMTTGLVPPGVRVAPNRHLYDERHVESLRLVVLLKERRNLSVDAIRKILPDLLQLPEGGAFRPEMWEQLVEARARSTARTSPAARLLEAGIDLFTRRGYSEVRVDDVCHAAKVAKGSFYRHFSSKEELFFTAARQVAAQTAERYETAVESSGGDDWSADKLVDALADAMAPNLSLLLDLTALAAQRRPGHGRVLQEAFTVIFQAVRTAGGRERDPRLLPDDLLERALVKAIRRAVLSPLLAQELDRAAR